MFGQISLSDHFLHRFATRLRLYFVSADQMRDWLVPKDEARYISYENITLAN